jgi:threonine aldolase
MTDWIDLRSDTVTRPTAGMRKAMYEAEVGDDVYGEDPTVNRLESLAAEMLGKEAGLFAASGTQTNLIALLTHCQRGHEYIVGATAHTYQYEGGGAAVLGGIQPQTVPFEADGTLDLPSVARVIKPDDFHFARTRLLCLENTQGGKATGPEYFQAARALVDEHNLFLHLDGARYFNAVAETGCGLDAISRPCDTVSICLSKGLGAPVGSVLVGPRDFIHEARRWRKMVGGGMRQAGVIAAAGIYALEHHVQRLQEDHEKAVRIAEAVNERFQGAAEQHTNMVFVSLPAERLKALLAHLEDNGIRATRPRWVTHQDISFEDVDQITNAVESA